MREYDIVWWLRRGFMALGVPVLASSCGGTGNACNKTVTIPWNGKLVDGGTAPYVPYDDCVSLCAAAAAGPYNSCTSLDAGLLTCSYVCVGGRAPPGMSELSAVSSAAGSWVARMAELEAAAVVAFTHTSNELHAHGFAGAASAALTAAEDEVRHAHAVTRLALRLGHSPVVRAIEPGEVRSLEAIAIDNAGEGCGRELFGSILNAHQAASASNAGVRQVMASIAADEAAHARFSFELAQQLMPKLSVAARRRAREAQAQVLEQLAHDELPEGLRTTLGLMDSAAMRKTTRRLLDSARV